MSSTVPQNPDCRGALLPYKDEYVYAAYEASEEQDYTYTMYDSKPNIIMNRYMAFFDVSSSKVVKSLVL